MQQFTALKNISHDNKLVRIGDVVPLRNQNVIDALLNAKAIEPVDAAAAPSGSGDDIRRKLLAAQNELSEVLDENERLVQELDRANEKVAQLNEFSKTAAKKIENFEKEVEVLRSEAAKNNADSKAEEPKPAKGAKAKK